jgi:alpha-glucosidase (family GH31 glycosyl hydrolase)
VPYLRESAARTVTTDTPLMRALSFDWPADPQVWEHPGQYLLGDDLLVNPVTQPGATDWRIYLPKGDWVEVWTGTNHSGEAEVVRPVTGHVIPVYCRAAAWPSLRLVFATLPA